MPLKLSLLFIDKYHIAITSWDLRKEGGSPGPRKFLCICQIYPGGLRPSLTVLYTHSVLEFWGKFISGRILFKQTRDGTKSSWSWKDTNSSSNPLKIIKRRLYTALHLIWQQFGYTRRSIEVIYAGSRLKSWIITKPRENQYGSGFPVAKLAWCSVESHSGLSGVYWEQETERMMGNDE